MFWEFVPGIRDSFNPRDSRLLFRDFFRLRDIPGIFIMPLSFLFEHIKKWWNKLLPEAGEVIFGQTFSKLWNMKFFERYCLSIDQWSFKNRVRKPSISGICLRTFPGKKMNKILIQLIRIKPNSYSRRETPPPSVDFYDRRLVISSAILKQGSFLLSLLFETLIAQFQN